MKDIKTKPQDGKPKVRNPASRMPKELARTTASIKEKTSRTREETTGAAKESPTEYASNTLELLEDETAQRTGTAAYVGGRKLAKKTKEKIKERKEAGRAEEAAQEAAESVRAVSQEHAEAAVSEPGSRNASRNPRDEAEKTAKRAAEKHQIKVKPEPDRDIRTLSKRNVKTAPRLVKSSPTSYEKVKTGQQAAAAKKRTIQSVRAARQAAVKSAQTVKNTDRTVKATARGIAGAVKGTAASLKALGAVIAAGGWIIVLLILILGIIGGVLFSGSSQSSEPLSQEVLSYTPVIQRYAAQYEIPEYVPVIQAIMMQESGGKGTDPMQSSECPYNTRYPNSPNAITDPEYSIQVGIQYYASCVKEAGCTGPQDMERLKLSLQGYNYGNGYISWAIKNFGGYSEANALQFSQEQAASHGWDRYGDPEYVPHVLRYYSGGGNIFAGLFGNEQIVTIAKTQIGNEGGQKFWSWYGFSQREEWCACFVSWCADQSGLIASGNVPKFSLCSDGVDWFKAKNKWQNGGYTPTPGTIIFFDWSKNGVRDGVSDHVGIVEKCENGMVYTIEGNSGDRVKQNTYDINSISIMGYGLVI